MASSEGRRPPSLPVVTPVDGCSLGESLRQRLTSARETRKCHQLATLAFVQNALLGGVIYGWASIDRGILVASKEEGGAGLSMHQTTRIFSIASSVAMMATLVLGALLDCCGPRVCSVISHVLIACGFGLFGNAQTPEHYIVAASMMAFGGRGIHVSIVHISNLFVGRQYLILGGLTGSVSLSFSVFSAFDWLWRRYQTDAVSLHRLFSLYTGLVVVSLVVSCVVWPDEKYPPPCNDGKNGGDNAKAILEDGDGIAAQPLRLCSLQESSDVETSSLIGNASNHSAYNSLHGSGFADVKDQSFAQQFCSVSYLLPMLFLVITSFLANFYVASYSTEVSRSRSFRPAKPCLLSVMIDT
jgi:hypothetical protein